MRAQVTIDTLITAAGITALAVALLTAFYGLYKTVDVGLRKLHLKYLAQVIEDRMQTCEYVDNVKIYAPYEVNVLCSEGKICWKDVCMPVRCRGGGEGKTFVVRGCNLVPE